MRQDIPTRASARRPNRSAPNRSAPTRAGTRALPAAVLVAVLALAACEPVPPAAPNPGPTTTTAPAPPTTTTAPPAPVTATGVPTPSAVQGDEFAGGLDPTRWGAEHSTYGNSGGGSRHCLLPKNVAVSGGTLKITTANTPTTCPDGSTQPYTSGFIGSRAVNRYYPLEGTFAIRARVPAAQGIWPAFWLRHRSGASVAEVDILESFHAQVPGQASQALHLDGQVNTAHRSTPFEPASVTPGWHEFAVRIDRTTGADGRDQVRFDFSVDGRATLGFTDTDPAWVTRADPAATWDIALNTAVDGRWVGSPDGPLGVLDQLGRCSQGGTYPNCSTAGLRRVDWSRPVVFEVDWVRVTPLAIP